MNLENDSDILVAMTIYRSRSISNLLASMNSVTNNKPKVISEKIKRPKDITKLKTKRSKPRTNNLKHK